MALPVAAAGAVKTKTAIQMAAFAKSMNKTDWDGVNSAMESIKGFGESASSVQEALGNINKMATGLVDIALGEHLAEVTGKVAELFDQLVPLATAIGTLTSAIDTTKLDDLIRLLRIFNLLVENGSISLETFADALGRLIGWLFGVPGVGLPGESPSTTPSSPSLPGMGKIGDIEGGF